MTFSPRAIEAAARALCVQSGDDPDKLTYAHAMQCTGHDREPKFTWQYWVPFAEAALSAALAVDGMALVPKEPTLEQHIAAMEFALAHMEAHGVTSLSPFEDYPPLRETTAGMYRAMLAAASDEPAPALQGWQPIESAPKDGTAFLAWEREWRGPFKCWWHVKNRNEAYWMDFDDSDPQPTHWQPLPPPPAASDREERR